MAGFDTMGNGFGDGGGNTGKAIRYDKPQHLTEQQAEQAEPELPLLVEGQEPQTPSWEC